MILTNMNKRIIILGDSFTFGHGCLDRIYYYDEDLKKFVGDITPMEKCIPSEYCWPALLQKDFPNIEVFNLSQPGHSNQGMFRNLLEFYSKHAYISDDLIIFNGTFSDRIEIRSAFDEDTIGSWAMGWEYMSLVENFKEYVSAQKDYIKYLYHEKIGFNLTVSSLLGAYGYATSNNHSFLYSTPIISPEMLLHTKKIFPDRIIPIIWYDFSGKNNYEFNVTCQAKDTHINERGHQIYYEKEIKPRIQQFL